MIQPHALIRRPPLALVIPKRPQRPVWMHFTQSVGPALSEQTRESFPALRLDQRVVIQRSGRVYVLCGPQFLEAHDVRLRFREPRQKIIETLVNVVDVERRDLHGLESTSGMKERAYPAARTVARRVQGYFARHHVELGEAAAGTVAL